MVTHEEYQNYIREIESELEDERMKSNDLARANHGQMSVFNNEQEDNLIRWQLDLKEDLDRIYHLLKGDMIVEEEDGSVVYKSPNNPDLKPFNEFGVQLLMNIMSFYLNRNTILSNYDDTTINWKVLDFGNEVSDLVFNRYDEMMVTIKRSEGETQEDWEFRLNAHIKNKIKLYPMIIRELVDTVHSAYLRAYHGGERESLRTARTVTQNEPLMRGNSMSPSVQQPVTVKRRWYNPTSW